MGVKKENWEMFKRYYYQQSFGVERWYPNLSEFTFPTEVIDLSEAGLFVVVFVVVVVVFVVVVVVVVV